MSWKFLLYGWGGLNAALFQIINHATPMVLMPLAWLFSNVLGNYWTAPLVMLGLWAWSISTAEAGHALAIRRQLFRFLVAFGIAFAIATFLKLLLEGGIPSEVG